MNGIGMNGIGMNGIGMNGIGMNGIGMNGIGMNGIGMNGIGMNGIGMNGIGMNGIGMNGIGMNGVALKDVSLSSIYVNELGLNGVGLDGLGTNAASVDQPGTFGVVIAGIGLSETTPDAIGSDDSDDNADNAGLDLSVNGLYLNGGRLRSLLADGASLTQAALGNIGALHLAHPLTTDTPNPLQLAGTTLDGIGADHSIHFKLKRVSFNGLFLAGKEPTALRVDGRPIHHHKLTELHVNGSGANSLTLRDSDDGSGLLSARQEQSLKVLMFYLAGCALSADDTISVQWSDSSVYYYRGARGIAPEWADGAISKLALRRVASCVRSSEGVYEGLPLTAEEFEVANTVLYHLVGCALPAGHEVSVRSSDGDERVYQGLRGFAPEWQHGPLSASGERSVRACLASSPSATAGVALNHEQADNLSQLLSYAVTCALPEAQSISVIDGAGAPVELQGVFGLAPEWASEPLSTRGQRLISACLAAHTNARGQHTRISMRGPGVVTEPVERVVYRHHEGAFWGNLFAPDATLYTCSVAGSGISGRDCTDGSCGFAYLGSCADVCGSQHGLDASFNDCAGDDAVLNTFLAHTYEAEGGARHDCDIDEDSQLSCFGDNSAGQLGDGAYQRRNADERVNVLDNVVEVGGGARHTCARTADGTALCWGDNRRGQLGIDRNAIRRPVPTKVEALGDNVASLAVGADHTCALATSGQLYCWGDNRDGQLGIDSAGERATAPVFVHALGDRVARIALGESAHHTCAITHDGALHCFGANHAGQLGDGGVTSQRAPVTIDAAANGRALPAITDVCTGASHTCARAIDGATYCWGENDAAQLGNGDLSGRTRPTRTALSEPIAQGTLTCGANHTCAVSETGATYCWGDNHAGQIDASEVAISAIATPSQLSLADDALRVTADAARTCVILDDGSRNCLGATGTALSY